MVSPRGEEEKAILLENIPTARDEPEFRRLEAMKGLRLFQMGG